jgi:hypothetical protein
MLGAEWASYKQRNFNKGMLAHWKFEGDYTDALGAHNGSAIGSPSFTTGIAGQAIALDGSSMAVSVADDAAFHVNAWSVSAWIYLVAGGGNEQGILGTRFGGDNTFDTKIRFTPGPQVHSDIGDGTNWINTSADANYTFNNSQWYMVTETVGNGRYDIYVNGTSIGGNNIAGTPLLMKAGQTMGLGLCSANEWFKGNNDEIYVWDRVLSASEIADLYSTIRV